MTYVQINNKDDYHTLMGKYAQLGWKWFAGEHPLDYDGYDSFKGYHCAVFMPLSDKFHINSATPQGSTVVNLRTALRQLNIIQQKLFERGFDKYYPERMWGVSTTSTTTTTERIKQTKQTTMSKLISTLRNLKLTSDDRLLMKLGLENPTNEPTQEGAQLFSEWMYNTNRDAYIKAVKELNGIIEEDENKVAKK